MKKKKWMGSLLNFIVPGLGNAYSRKLGKGILVYLLFFIVVFSLRFIAYNFELFLAAFTLIIGYYLFLIISGYHDVKRNKEYEPLKFDKWYVYLLIITIHFIGVNEITGQTIDNLTPINFASIPTPAMDPALMVGDILAYKKVKTIERNDVVIFWFPEDTTTRYIKRCIGLPGDSLQIKRSIVSINNDSLPIPLPLKFKYFVTTNGEIINSRRMKELEIKEQNFYRISSDNYLFYLTMEQVEKMKELKFLNNIEMFLANEGETEISTFPHSEKVNWNTDFFGPIYIPKKGDKIHLNEINIDLYFNCLIFENEMVELTESGLHIDGELIEQYEFKENYFFMMGDNRHNSLDSRYWGFLPQSLIIGKAMYLYWAEDYDRIGKRII